MGASFLADTFGVDAGDFCSFAVCFSCWKRHLSPAMHFPCMKNLQGAATEGSFGSAAVL